MLLKLPPLMIEIPEGLIVDFTSIPLLLNVPWLMVNVPFPPFVSFVMLKAPLLLKTAAPESVA